MGNQHETQPELWNEASESLRSVSDLPCGSVGQGFIVYSSRLWQEATSPLEGYALLWPQLLCLTEMWVEKLLQGSW